MADETLLDAKDAISPSRRQLTLPAWLALICIIAFSVLLWAGAVISEKRPTCSRRHAIDLSVNPRHPSQHPIWTGNLPLSWRTRYRQHLGTWQLPRPGLDRRRLTSLGFSHRWHIIQQQSQLFSKRFRSITRPRTRQFASTSQ